MPGGAVLKKVTKGGRVPKGLNGNRDRKTKKAMRAALLVEQAMAQLNDRGSGFGSARAAIKAASTRATSDRAKDRVEVASGAAVAAASSLLGAVEADGTAADIRKRAKEGRREVAACGQAAACGQDAPTFAALAAEGAPLLEKKRARTAAYLETSADKPANIRGKKQKKADGSFVTKDEERVSARKRDAAYRERGYRSVRDGDEAENEVQFRSRIDGSDARKVRKYRDAAREARGGAPRAVGGWPRSAANAALHRDVSYASGCEPGNTAANPVKYRARIKQGIYKGKDAINRDKNSIYYKNTWFETEAAAIAALPARQRGA